MEDRGFKSYLELRVFSEFLSPHIILFSFNLMSHVIQVVVNSGEYLPSRRGKYLQLFSIYQNSGLSEPNSFFFLKNEEKPARKIQTNARR